MIAELGLAALWLAAPLELHKLPMGIPPLR